MTGARLQNADRRARGGFTVIELMVAVSIIVILASLMVPTFIRAREMSRRAVCASNLRQIHVGAISRATAHNGEFPKCLNRSVLIAFAELGASNQSYPQDRKLDWIKQLQTFGIDPYGGVWNCPSRNFKSQYEPQFRQAVVAYQFFGGVQKWTNPWGEFAPRSPVRMQWSDPQWTLAADTACKIDGAWGGGRATAYGGLPSHMTNPDELGPPEGGNHLFVNGAVRWVPFQDMVFVHNWHGDYSRINYSYHEDLGDFVPPPEALAQP